MDTNTVIITTAHGATVTNLVIWTENVIKVNTHRVVVDGTLVDKRAKGTRRRDGG